MDTKQDKTQLALNLKKVLELYSLGGFYVQTILMDMEFDKVKDIIPMVNINISAANEHVTDVEQRIHTMKKDVGGSATLPFTHPPQELINGLVQFITMWLNKFLSNNGISRKWSL